MLSAAGLVAGGLASSAAADSSHTLSVSPNGSPTYAGTYAEDVPVSQPLTLVGWHATIDASGMENAVHMASSHLTVRG